MPTPRSLPYPLGVTLVEGGANVAVYSESASDVFFSSFDGEHETRTPLPDRTGYVWHGFVPGVEVGTRYGLRVDGPWDPENGLRHNVHKLLLDPHALAISGNYAFDQRLFGHVMSDPMRRDDTDSASAMPRCVVVDRSFDWGDDEVPRAPRVPLEETIVYETHVKGFTKRLPGIPEELQGTYAGLAHPKAIQHLVDLGITSVELLPVHQFVQDATLTDKGLSNYWGYNTIGFFAPNGAYCSTGDTGGQVAEFKSLVKALHAAGLEVILDVVYNHTAEEGIGGPRTSFRGIDNRGYYRQTDEGEYIDTTGCGNTLDFGAEVPQRLVRDSIRYWANEMQIDGFRFDLAATLGRNDRGHFDPEHPLLYGLRDDPELAGVKLIAEPWDVGMGGWQTGNFPYGWSEWNDSYRGSVRDFWLTDLASMRGGGAPRNGIGRLAGSLAGSADVFRATRGPLTSINFVTAHDGFTLADLTAFNDKHNIGNGERNRDGTDDNRSFNFGVEGETRSPRIRADRRRAMRNLLGTLLLSAGVPMITAGDEHGRTQRGNNNAYCHDSELTWVSWKHADWQRELHGVTKRLLQLRRENPALRPVRYAKHQTKIPSASEMSWYSAAGLQMSTEDWNSTMTRCVQYIAASTPEFEDFNRVLVVVHGAEQDLAVVLPAHDDVAEYQLLWSSAGHDEGTIHQPGEVFAASGPTITLFRAQ